MYLIDHGEIERCTLSAWVNDNGDVVLGDRGSEGSAFYTMNSFEARKLASELKAAAHEANHEVV